MEHIGTCPGKDEKMKIGICITSEVKKMYNDLLHRLALLGEYVRCDPKFFIDKKARIGIVIDKSPDEQLLKIKSVEHPKLFFMPKSNVISLQNIDEAPDFILLKNPKNGKRFWTIKITI